MHLYERMMALTWSRDAGMPQWPEEPGPERRPFLGRLPTLPVLRRFAGSLMKRKGRGLPDQRRHGGATDPGFIRRTAQ